MDIRIAHGGYVLLQLDLSVVLGVAAVGHDESRHYVTEIPCLAV